MLKSGLDAPENLYLHRCYGRYLPLRGTKLIFPKKAWPFHPPGPVLKTFAMIDQMLTQSGLEPPALDLFKAALRPRELKKGDHFVSRGQLSRFIALVETGYLRVYHPDATGQEITTDFCQPAAFCGSYYSFYAQQPALEYIQAITDCRLFLLSYSALQKLYDESFQMNVFGRLVLEKACLERDLRLKKIMHLSAREKYEWFLEKYPAVYKVAQLGHIASFLGINPETLSRVRRALIS